MPKLERCILNLQRSYIIYYYSSTDDDMQKNWEYVEYAVSEFITECSNEDLLKVILETIAKKQ